MAPCFESVPRRQKSQVRFCDQNRSFGPLETQTGHEAFRGRDETKVARGGSSSPTVRRRELGALLRKLRTDLELTAEEVTGSLLFSPTKLSRIETGQTGATARD